MNGQVRAVTSAGTTGGGNQEGTSPDELGPEGGRGLTSGVWGAGRMTLASAGWERPWKQVAGEKHRDAALDPRSRRR